MKHKTKLFFVGFSYAEKYLVVKIRLSFVLKYFMFKLYLKSPHDVFLFFLIFENVF